MIPNLKAKALLDQDWENAKRWLVESNPQIVTALMDLLVEVDRPEHFLALGKIDPAAADIVARLAILALHEVCDRITEEGCLA